MPGHSGKDFYLFKANELDITEIEGLDNLLTSSGVILDAENLIAKAYGYKHSLALHLEVQQNMLRLAYL